VKPARARSARWYPGLLALLLLAPACGKVGPPMPPLPRGPLAPEAVAARQIGDRVVVGFNVSAARGDKPAQQPVRAELVRVGYSAGLEPPPDPDAFRRRGEVVGQLLADPLEEGARMFLEDSRLAELPEGGLGWTLRYGVRVRDRRGRPSPLVVAKDLIPLPTAPEARLLTAEPTAAGVRLVWEAPAGEREHTFNVYRSAPGVAWPDSPLNAAPLAITAYLDSLVEIGRTYAYTVRVSLAPDMPYRESKASNVFELVAEDRFAPDPPDGLIVVQEGVGVRLFWNPNSERDLAGYRIYRSREGEDSWHAVGPDRIDTPSFLDTDVRVGERWTYRVTAVDRADRTNESAPSAVVDVELVQEPGAPGSGDR